MINQINQTFIQKKCHICKGSFPNESFYKNSTKPDGLSSSCRTCHKEWRKSHYLRNRERVNISNRRWSRAHPEATRAYARVVTRRDYINKVKPLKLYMIYGLVKRSLRDGIIIKAPCRICGDVKVEAHHEDYSRPLDVLWYCHRHHGRLHQIVGTRLDTYRELLTAPIPPPAP